VAGSSNRPGLATECCASKKMPKLKVPTAVAPTPAADQAPPIQQQLQSPQARRPLASALQIDVRGPASGSPSTTPFKRGPRMKSCRGVAVKSRKSGSPRRQNGLMADVAFKKVFGGSDDEVRSFEAFSVLNSFRPHPFSHSLSPSGGGKLCRVLSKGCR
jgi:hypothetical protein